MHRFNLFILLVSCTSIWSVNVLSQTDWEYNLLRFEYNTSNPEIASFDIRIKRSKSRSYAFNGTFNIGDDIDDRYSASLKVYRSPTGSSQYMKSPYNIELTNFYSFMTIVYVRLLQKEASRCSNLPVHEKRFNTPLAKGKYYVNMCIVSNENMPLHMQPGFYKLTAYFEGPNFYLYLSAYAEVQHKSLVLN